MRTRWTKGVGLLLLCIFAVAIVHQTLPHHPGHGDGKYCSLCLLLMSAVILAAGVNLFLRREMRVVVLTEDAIPFPHSFQFSYTLRGPPCQ